MRTRYYDIDKIQINLLFLNYRFIIFSLKPRGTWDLGLFPTAAGNQLLK